MLLKIFLTVFLYSSTVDRLNVYIQPLVDIEYEQDQIDINWFENKTQKVCYIISFQTKAESFALYCSHKPLLAYTQY